LKRSCCGEQCTMSSYEQKEKKVEERKRKKDRKRT